MRSVGESSGDLEIIEIRTGGKQANKTVKGHGHLERKSGTTVTFHTADEL
jgi:hypothetical protein